ncbi:MAG: hypothetical protein ACRCVA_34250 [Phreatobacter sp.]
MARIKQKASPEDLLGEDWFRATNAARASERARFKVWLDTIRTKIHHALDHPGDLAARAELEASLDMASATLAQLDAQDNVETDRRFRELMSVVQRLSGR